MCVVLSVASVDEYHPADPVGCVAFWPRLFYETRPKEIMHADYSEKELKWSVR